MTIAKTSRRIRRLTDLGNYKAVAEAFGLGLCDCGRYDRRQMGNHRTGWTAYRMGVIHWYPRNLTRRGLYRFLKLVAITNDAACSKSAYPKPLRIYLQNVMAVDLAVALGVRIPREFSAHDRARVRASIHQARDLDPSDRRRIYEWSRP